MLKEEIIEALKGKALAEYQQALINLKTVVENPTANADGTTNIVAEAERHLDVANCKARRLQILADVFGE